MAIQVFGEFGIENEGKIWCTSCGQEIITSDYDSLDAFKKSGARDVTHEEIDDEEITTELEANELVKTMEMYIKK